jgi:predicted nuclease of restriction endonuclease-like (RecB) superfamily
MFTQIQKEQKWGDLYKILMSICKSMEDKKDNQQIVSTMPTGSLIQDLRHIIEQARGQVAATANYTQTMMYWHIGERINREVLGNQRAEYGKQIVSTVSRQLQETYGKKGFEERTIRRMMQFAQMFPDIQIVSTVLSKLSWSHFLIVMPLKDELQREFYLTMAATERWSVRQLQKEIDNMLFERTAIATKPDELIKKELSTLRDNDVMSPDLVFKSPYFLEFTGLKGMYSERDLEDSLVAHIEQFIIELGNGFTFVARQKRMIIDGEDFYLDLLFYHRRLHRLIAIDLKLGRFKAQYKGQMELYLRWLEKHEMEPGEESPLGLLLCTEGSEEQIELLQLDQSGIKVAQYMTELPPRDVLMRQIQKSLEAAKVRFENYIEEDEA